MKSIREIKGEGKRDSLLLLQDTSFPFLQGVLARVLSLWLIDLLEHHKMLPICKYVDVCVQLYRIVPISPSDGTTKVERCVGVNVNCEAGEA